MREKEFAEAVENEGTINVSNYNGKAQYYLNCGGVRNYIRESEIGKVRELCQNEYDIKVLRAARKELKYLNKIASLHGENEQGECCEAVYARMPVGRKQMISPIALPDDEYMKQWEAVVYERKGFREDAPNYYTDKGERVRSKAEILIANMLNKHGIPYRYECPLVLKGYGMIYPDFTILHMRERKEMYLEHMGMMDNEIYAEEALERILMYEKNGIFPGEKLVLTHETGKKPMDSRLWEKIICHYFL